MDRRRAASLLALAACFACSAAAPTANNQTALDLYEKDASVGCYYNFQHYGEGDRIMTNEPCLNCTCHNRMLMCYLRVCPFTKPIGQDCTVEKRADQCCPIVTCPDVPVDLLTSTSTSSPAEYGSSGVGRLDRYGCVINGRFLPEGSKVPPMPNKPCEHCYCIRNMTTCVMQECTLHVDGCTPIYHKDVCCPVRYSCDHPEDEIPLLDDMTTTVRPTPGFLLTTTTVPSVTQIPQDCVHDDEIFPDGSLIKTEKACEHCYCMKGDIVCVVQECGTPMENEGKNCTSLPPREGQCCPDTYICEGDNELPLDEITTYIPPRTPDFEGSGYRIEPDASTVAPSEPEGSGEEITSEMYATTISHISTPQSMVKDEYPSYSTPGESETEVTSEPDKGENTVPIDSSEEKSTKLPFETRDKPSETTPVPEDDLITEFVPVTDITKLDEETVTPKLSSESATDSKLEITPPEQVYTSTVPTKETTQADYEPAQSTKLSEPEQDHTEGPTTSTSRAPKPTEGEEPITGTEQYVTESALGITKPGEVASETPSHEVETEKSDSPTTESALMTEQHTEENPMDEKLMTESTQSSEENVTPIEGTTQSVPNASESSEENVTFEPTGEQFITDTISDTITTAQESGTPKYGDKVPVTESTIKITEPTDQNQTTKLSGEPDVTETGFETTEFSPEKETIKPSDEHTDITTEKLYIAETELPITTMEPNMAVTSQTATQPEEESKPQTTLSDSISTAPTDIEESEIKTQKPITDEEVTESSQLMTTSEKHQFTGPSSDVSQSSEATQTPENYVTKVDVQETIKPDEESQTQSSTEEQHMITTKITQPTEESSTLAPVDVQRVTETVYLTLGTSSPVHNQVTEKTQTSTIESDTDKPIVEQTTSGQPQMLDESITTVVPLATESATDSTFINETQKPESDSSLPSTGEVVTTTPTIDKIVPEEKDKEKPSDMELVTESIIESSQPVETSEEPATTEPSLESVNTEETSQPSTEYLITEAGPVSANTTDASITTALSQESITGVPDTVTTTISSEKDYSKPSYETETTIAEDKDRITTETDKDHTTPEIMSDTTKAFTESSTSPALNEQTGTTYTIPTDIKLKDGDLSPESQFTTPRSQEESVTLKSTTITEFTTESEISTDVPTIMQQPLPTDCGTEGCDGEGPQKPISSICTTEDCTLQDCGPDGCALEKIPDLNKEPESATSIPECNSNECQQPDQNVECTSGNCAAEESCAGDDCKDSKTVTTTAKEEQVFVTTEPSPRKEDVGTTFMESITEDTSDILKATTISSESVSTETTEKQEITSVHPSIPTEIDDKSSTSASLLPDITTPQADLYDKESTIQPEFESSTNIPGAGVIPGEGNCLVDGKTYLNDSEIPSADKCQTNCRCASSIVKCDPIICSLPPDDMVNCQAVYDNTDTCCPTYVCDPTKETIPPQPHSQMSGTESPIKDKGETCTGMDCQQPEPEQFLPNVDCQGQKCDEKVTTPVDTSPLPQEPLECIGENCQSESSSIACNGADCVPVSTQPVCENGQNCDTEKIPIQICKGAECINPTTAPSKETDIITTESVADITEGTITQSVDVTNEKTTTPFSQEITHPSTESDSTTSLSKIPEIQDAQEATKAPSDPFEQQTTENIIDATETRVTGMPEKQKSTTYPSTDLDKPSTESVLDTQNTTDMKDCGGDKTDCLPQVECSDDSCVKVDIGPPVECSGESCVKVEVGPPDECSGDTCVKVETEKPVECTGESCVKVEVGPPVECTGESCVEGETEKPVECTGESCVKVDVGPSTECSDESCVKNETEKPVECTGESCVEGETEKPVECTGESCVKVDVGPSVECSDESCVKVETEKPVECTGESCVKVDVGSSVECSDESCFKVETEKPVECTGESCVKVDVGPPAECSGESCVKVDVGPPVECSGESCVKVDVEPPAECSGESCVKVDVGPPAECSGESCVKVDVGPPVECSGESCVKDETEKPVECTGESCITVDFGELDSKFGSPCDGEECVSKPSAVTASTEEIYKQTTQIIYDTSDSSVTDIPEDLEASPLPGKETDKTTTESDIRGTKIPEKTEATTTETTIDTTSAKVTQTPELQETRPAEITTEGEDIVQPTTERQNTLAPEKYETTLEPFITTTVTEQSSADAEIPEDKIASTALPMLTTEKTTEELLQDTSAFPQVTEKTTSELIETDKKTTQEMIIQTEEILTTSISPLTDRLPEVEDVTDAIATTNQPFTVTTGQLELSTLMTTPSEKVQTDLPQDMTEKQYYSTVPSEFSEDKVTTTKPEATDSEYLETSTEPKEPYTLIPEVPVTVQESSTFVPETQPTMQLSIDTEPKLETTETPQATTYQADTNDTTELEMTKSPELIPAMEIDVTTKSGAAETTEEHISTTEKSQMATEIIEQVTEKTISPTAQPTESFEPEPTDITVPTSEETTSDLEHSTPYSIEKVPEAGFTQDDTVTTSTEIIPTQPKSETIIPELVITTTGEIYTTTGRPVETIATETKMPEIVPEQETQPEAATTNVPVMDGSDTKQTEPISQENITQPAEETTTPLPDISSQTETTPYLIELVEHTHKDEIMTTEHPLAMGTSTESIPTDQETVKPIDMPSSYQTSEDKETTEPSSGTDSAADITTLQTSTPTVTLSDELLNKFGETSEPSTSQPQLIESDNSHNLSTILPETQSPQTSTSQPVTEQAAETTENKRIPDNEETVAPTTVKVAPEEATTPTQFDKYTKPELLATTEKVTETERPSLGGTSTDEESSPGEESFPPTEPETGYGQEPDYVDEDQAFGPGTCRYGGKVYVSAQQIPRDDPCDFCFCFRSDIICLQQSCPPPIHGCHEEPIQGFCCPRYECPVSMATTMNVTTTTTTTTTTLPPHFLPHAYKGAAQRKGCQIKGHAYKVGEVVRASSGPCLHCTCGGDGQMKCDPKVCTPEPMLRQMIAAAVSSKRRR